MTASQSSKDSVTSCRNEEGAHAERLHDRPAEPGRNIAYTLRIFIPVQLDQVQLDFRQHAFKQRIVRVDEQPGFYQVRRGGGRLIRRQEKQCSSWNHSGR